MTDFANHVAAFKSMMDAQQPRQKLLDSLLADDPETAALLNEPDPTTTPLPSPDVSSGAAGATPGDVTGGTAVPGAAPMGAIGRAINATNMPQGKAPSSHAANLPAAKGNLGNWIAQALSVLKLDNSYAPGIAALIQQESGGNPTAINNWDSNAKAGHPSQGLMQTIPGTFAEYALPGYNKSITDPVSNIIAGTRYALKNYGPNMLKSGGRHDAKGNYVGY